MKFVYLILFLPTALRGLGQCPFQATITTPSVCLGATLTSNTAQTPSKIVWFNGNVMDSTALATHTTIYTGITVAGGNGAGPAPDQTSYPMSIAMDAAGDLYVCDEGNNRVQKWPPGATSGITVAGGNGFGNRPDQLYSPAGIFLDDQGDIYVADQSNARIQKWPPGAAAGITVAGGNGFGTNPNQLFLPVSVYVDAAGNIFIADAGNNRVQKWPPGATSGITVAGGNGAGAGADQLNKIEGLWVDQGGAIYIADAGNFRVQKWLPGAGSGITVAGGNGFGAGADQLGGPWGLYVDPSGNLYVAESVNNRVEEWAPGATSGITVAGGNGDGDAANQFSACSSILFDNNGVLYIADNNNHRVQKWVQEQQTTIGNTYTPLMPGTYTAVITDDAGCTVSSNAITINPSIIPTIQINGPDTAVCSGYPAAYAATISNAGAAPSWVWSVNGMSAGEDSPSFVSADLKQGDTISCRVSFDAVCTSPATAETIALIHPTPVIQQGEVYTLIYGQRLTLRPSIEGEIANYQWSPSPGLSDTTIAAPVANPLTNTDYTLRVTATDGCASAAIISVKVNSPVGIPNAFTPNGDGKNDILYIKGGAGGTLIHAFQIFNRWGAIVFHAVNAPPDDPAYGWNGLINGQPAPAGVYVYEVILSLPGSGEEKRQGTVLLIR